MNGLGGRIGAVVLFVEDIARSRAFYHDVIELPILYEDESSVVIGLEGTMVVLLQRAAAGDLLGGEGAGAAPGEAPAFQLSVFVDDVDGAHARLRDRGVRFFIDPVDREWGKRTAHFNDPDGHVWELAQDISR